MTSEMGRPSGRPSPEKMTATREALAYQVHSHTQPWLDAMAEVERWEQERAAAIRAGSEWARTLNEERAAREAAEEAMRNGDRLLSECGRKLEAVERDAQRRTDLLNEALDRAEAAERDRDAWRNSCLDAQERLAERKQAQEAAERERDEARESAKRLNRRATQAEAVVMQTVEDCKRQGVSVGRALANVACNSLEARAEKAEAENQRLREALDEIASKPYRAEEVVARLAASPDLGRDEEGGNFTGEAKEARDE